MEMCSSNFESPLNDYSYENVVKEAPISKGLTLNKLIQHLHEAFKTDSVNIDRVQDLMSEYRSNPLEWKKYAKFDRYR